MFLFTYSAHVAMQTRSPSCKQKTSIFKKVQIFRKEESTCYLFIQYDFKHILCGLSECRQSSLPLTISKTKKIFKICILGLRIEISHEASRDSKILSSRNKLAKKYQTQKSQVIFPLSLLIEQAGVVLSDPESQATGP